jgi:hypothetical protein
MSENAGVVPYSEPTFFEVFEPNCNSDQSLFAAFRYLLNDGLGLFACRWHDRILQFVLHITGLDEFQ